MNRRRRKLSAEEETSILVRSRRRCCLCFGLRFDLDYKAIQIAHVDHNPSNNDPDNLAVLCLEHHDAYDSTTSQAKGFTESELRKHRENLYEVLAKKEGRVTVQFVPSDKTAPQSAHPSSKMLGEMLAAFDAEIEQAQRQQGYPPNGIRIHRIAVRALEEEGDFDVTAEGFNLLLNLSEDTTHEYLLLGQNPIRHARPFPLAMDILSRIARTDFGLFTRVINGQTDKCISGGIPLAKLSDSVKQLPHTSFDVVTGVLWGCCMATMPEAEWAKDAILQRLAPIAVKLAFIMAFRGESIPLHADRIWYSASGRRAVQPGQPDNQLTFVRMLHRMASLPQPLFIKAREYMKFSYPLNVNSFAIDTDAGLTAPKVLDMARGWALINSVGVLIAGPIPIKTTEDKQICEDEVAKLAKLGRDTAERCQNWLLEERRLLCTPKG